uniref:Complex 1 LYR protein domain-containing protein n=1 Tax=Ascaris lumbricoides TaxID=6252 RepID=A0A9J2QA58_ASCLU
MGSISKQAWIKIYKDLQRAATQFPQYYYREFFKRRIRDHFTAVDSKLSDTERYKVILLSYKFRIYLYFIGR